MGSPFPIVYANWSLIFRSVTARTDLRLLLALYLKKIAIIFAHMHIKSNIAREVLVRVELHCF